LQRFQVSGRINEGKQRQANGPAKGRFGCHCLAIFDRRNKKLSGLSTESFKLERVMGIEPT
jgi:hypothetical protein